MECRPLPKETEHMIFTSALRSADAEASSDAFTEGESGDTVEETGAAVVVVVVGAETECTFSFFDGTGGVCSCGEVVAVVLVSSGIRIAGALNDGTVESVEEAVGILITGACTAEVLPKKIIARMPSTSAATTLR